MLQNPKQYDSYTILQQKNQEQWAHKFKILRPHVNIVQELTCEICFLFSIMDCHALFTQIQHKSDNNNPGGHWNPGWGVDPIHTYRDKAFRWLRRRRGVYGPPAGKKMARTPDGLWCCCWWAKEVVLWNLHNVVSVLLHRSGFLKKGNTCSIVGCYTELVNASMSSCSDGD